MRDNFHASVNTTWYSVLFYHKLTKLFSIENFSGAKHAGKVLIIIIILFLIIIFLIALIPFGWLVYSDNAQLTNVVKMW